MKIVDAFTFFNEVHLLELRLALLADVVDVFVIAEMSVTHSGLSKGFVLEPYLDSLPVPRSRIVYVQVSDGPQVDARLESDRWLLENFQRNALARGVATLALEEDDLVLISDLDELPDPAAIAFAAGALQTQATAVFCQLHRKFFINAIADIYTTGQCWLGTVATSAGRLARTCPQDLRRGPGFPRAAYLWTTGRAEDTIYVENGGWHLTYCNGPGSVGIKMQSTADGTFAHQAKDFHVPSRSRHNWRAGRGPQILAWRAGLDATIIDVDALGTAPLTYLPAPMKRDPLRWEWLWWYSTPIDQAVDLQAKFFH